MTSWIDDWLLTNNCKVAGYWGHVNYKLFQITFGTKYNIFFGKTLEQEVGFKITLAKVVPNHSYLLTIKYYRYADFILIYYGGSFWTY